MNLLCAAVLFNGLTQQAWSFTIKIKPLGHFTAHTQIRKLHSTQESQSQFNIDTNENTPQLQLRTSLPECQYTQVMHTNDLMPISTELRKHYDTHFQDPRQPDGNRFVWDPWYVNVGDGKQPQNDDENTAQERNMNMDEDHLVPGEQEATDGQTQYSLKRIQANNFFNDHDFSTLVEDLTLLGRSIGLTAITPPWISMYTDGDMQNLHTDAPQGPVAFVLSLCREHEFQGGETIMLKPNVMELWKGFDGSVGMETGSIMRYIPPTPLGRCIVFDPRVPHGVNRVKGLSGNGNDPRKARVVVHGWFNNPEVCWFGNWEENDLEKMNAMLDKALQPIVESLGSGEIGRVCGYLACRIEIDEDGDVKDVVGVCDTLQADWDDFRGVIGYDEEDRPVMEEASSDIKLTIYENMKGLNFGDGDDGRAVVVPFAFE
eukprot:scaffold10575_cov275-Chaetoceros_neogracile.AAC.4